MLFTTYSLFLFFFKQKTAYEMRISDWSSDVCSSDLTTGCVFNGSALGKEYSAKGILERLAVDNESKQKGVSKDIRQVNDNGQQQADIPAAVVPGQAEVHNHNDTGLNPLEVLIRAEDTYSHVPYELRNKKKKKKKKKQ